MAMGGRSGSDGSGGVAAASSNAGSVNNAAGAASDAVGAAGAGGAAKAGSAAGGDAGGADNVEDPFSATPHCSSRVIWDPNESEGLDMMPGHACNTCHAESNAATGEGDAPIFAFAGTVFPTGHEPDNCVGSAAEGAMIVVTDAKGKQFSATVNYNGNFSFEDDAFTYPLHAKVVFHGRERVMLTPQTNGDCNHCHSAEGIEAAPGRIALP